MEITLNEPFIGDYQVKYSWKRDLLPIIPSEFVKKRSNRPYIQARNTILSTFHLMLYSCSDAWLAFESVSKLVNKFCANGFSKEEILELLIHRLVNIELSGIKFQPSSLITFLRL